MSNEIDVKIKADASGVKPGTDAAAAAVASASSKMRSEFDALHQNASGAFAKIQEGLKGVGESFLKFNEVAVAAVAIFAGGKMFGEFVNEAMKVNGEVLKLSKTLGISTEEASGLNSALNSIGFSADDYAAASLKLTRQLRMNEDALNDVGLKTRDADGHFKNLKELMEDSINVLKGYKEGVDRDMAAQMLFGRGVGDVNALLKLNSDRLKEGEENAHRFGLVVGKENVEAQKEYKLAINESKEVVAGLEKAVGDILMPILTEMATFFNSIGPDAIKVTHGAFAGLMIPVHGLIVGIKELWDICKLFVKDTVTLFLGFGEVLYSVFTGDFDRAKRASKSTLEQIKDQNATTWEEMVSDAEKGREKLENMFKKPTSIEHKDSGKHLTGEEGKKDTSTDTRLAAWKNELEQKKQSEGAFFKDSVAADLAYWQEKLSHVTGSGEKDIALRQHIESEIFNLKKQAAVQERALAEETESQKLKLAQGAIEAKREQLSALHDLGKISDEQYLVELQQTADHEYQLERDLMEKKAALYEGDALAKMKVLDQMAVMEQKHALQLQKTTNQMAVQHKKNIEQMLQPVQQAVSHSVQGIVMGTTTAKKAMQNLLKSMLAETIDFLTKKGIKFAAEQLLETQETAAQTAARKALEASSAAESAAIQHTTGATAVMSNAAMAASGAMASVSAIPFVGWAMAPGVGASTYALGMSYLASAEGGYDIPGSLNPITQLHEKEMVLPAKHAEVIRNMADTGGGGGGAIHMHVHTQSTHDFQAFLKKNSHTLAPAIRRMGRNFAPMNGGMSPLGSHS